MDDQPHRFPFVCQILLGSIEYRFDLCYGGISASSVQENLPIKTVKQWDKLLFRLLSVVPYNTGKPGEQNVGKALHEAHKTGWHIFQKLMVVAGYQV